MFIQGYSLAEEYLFLRVQRNMSRYLSEEVTSERRLVSKIPCLQAGVDVFYLSRTVLFFLYQPAFSPAVFELQ